MSAGSLSIPKWKKKLPMWLTWARIGLSPVIVVLLLFTEPTYGYLASALFILASITDWFDGYLARLYKAETTMGKFMDPIADKILVASVLIMLLPLGRVDPVMVLILLVRDILIGGIRSVAAADGVVIAAKNAGKWKTALQMIGIPAILIHTPVFGFPVHGLGIALLWISVVFSLISGVQYTLLYFRAAKA
jgi:CDP-diacylglycerol--glycerol-3-phosphate 3-phosphatidyltransferase